MVHERHAHEVTHMFELFDALLLARIQFAFTVAFQEMQQASYCCVFLFGIVNQICFRRWLYSGFVLLLRLKQ